jgi:transposase, IS5 family
VTNREGFALAAKALPGNPYDGHTLATTVEQIVAIAGIAPERIYVDKGYRGHDYSGKERVFLSGQRRGLTATIHRELRRRAAIEPMIGHMKTDGRLDRNYLLGTAGDAINALLAAAGHNLRLILAHLSFYFARVLAILIATPAASALHKSDAAFA